MDWQPIKTAPKEWLVLVLLYGGSPDDFDDEYAVAYWNSVEKEWNTTAPPFRLNFTPTHWHPIAQPPEENK